MPLVLAGLGVIVGLAAALQAELVAGLAVAALLALGVLVRPAGAALLLVAAVPVTAGLRRGLPVPALRASEAAIVGVSALTLVVLERERAVRWRSFDWWAFAYVVCWATTGVINVVRHGSGFGTEALQQVVAPLQFLLLHRVVATHLVGVAHRRRALQLVLLASVPVSVIAVLQQLDLFGMKAFVASITAGEVFSTWSYENYPRATGVFPIWHALAGYLLLVLLLAATMLAARELAVLSVRWLGVVVGCAMAALMLSQSFSAIFGVAVGSLIIFWRLRSARALGYMVVGGLVAGLLFGSFLAARLEQQVFDAGEGVAVPQTIDYRFKVWGDQYAPVLADYWLLGFGPGLPPDVEWQHTESLYLTLLLRGGVPLLVVYTGMIVHLGRAASRATRSPDAPQRTVALTLYAAVVVLAPMNAIWPYFTNSGLPQLFWALTGLLVSAEASPVTAREQPARVATGV